MSGLPESNFPAFNVEAQRLRSLGFDVVNPADLNPDPSTPWKECLRSDLAALLDCDVIAMLPGWENSQGAHLELHVAHRVGIRIETSANLTEPDPNPEGPSIGDTSTPFGMTVRDHLAASLKWLDTRRERLHYAGCTVHAPSARCNCGLHTALTDLRAAFNALGA
jgi:hypothetical protein